MEIFMVAMFHFKFFVYRFLNIYLVIYIVTIESFHKKILSVLVCITLLFFTVACSNSSATSNTKSVNLPNTILSQAENNSNTQSISTPKTVS